MDVCIRCMYTLSLVCWPSATTCAIYDFVLYIYKNIHICDMCKCIVQHVNGFSIVSEMLLQFQNRTKQSFHSMEGVSQLFQFGPKMLDVCGRVVFPICFAHQMLPKTHNSRPGQQDIKDGCWLDLGGAGDVLVGEE